MLVIKLSCVWDSGNFWSSMSLFHWHRLSSCFSYFSEYRYKPSTSSRLQWSKDSTFIPTWCNYFTSIPLQIPQQKTHLVFGSKQLAFTVKLDNYSVCAARRIFCKKISFLTQWDLSGLGEQIEGNLMCWYYLAAEDVSQFLHKSTEVVIASVHFIETCRFKNGWMEKKNSPITLVVLCPNAMLCWRAILFWMPKEKHPFTRVIIVP